MSDGASHLANNLLKLYKRSGIGAGARSGMHGTPYLRAGNELLKLANNKAMGYLPEFREALKQIGKRWIKKGRELNHPMR